MKLLIFVLHLSIIISETQANILELLRDLSTTITQLNPAKGSTQDIKNVLNLNSKSKNTSNPKQKIYDDYKLFSESCNVTNPMSTKDCTYQSYPGFWCCHVDFIVAPNSSYCATFSDKYAKALINNRSLYYSYTCSYEYLRLYISIIYLIIIVLLF